jgi:hypothetical protein
MVPTETHLMWHDLVVVSQNLRPSAQNDLTHTGVIAKELYISRLTSQQTKA